MTSEVNSTIKQQFINMPIYVTIRAVLWAGVNRRWGSSHPESFIVIKTLLPPYLQPFQWQVLDHKSQDSLKVTSGCVVTVEPQWHPANLTSAVGQLIRKCRWDCSWMMRSWEPRTKGQLFKVLYPHLVRTFPQIQNFLKLGRGG